MMAPFRYWRKALGLTQAEAAAKLGVCKRTAEGYDRLDDLPRMVRLAMAAINQDLEPYHE